MAPAAPTDPANPADPMAPAAPDSEVPEAGLAEDDADHGVHWFHFFCLTNEVVPQRCCLQGPPLTCYPNGLFLSFMEVWDHVRIM